MGIEKLKVLKPSGPLCPSCKGVYTNVIDVRYAKSHTYLKCPYTRRRRVCLSCDYRFTTYEFTDSDIKMIIRKKGIRRLSNDISKLRRELKCGRQ